MAHFDSKALGLIVAMAFAFAAPCPAQETVADYIKIAEQKASDLDYDGALVIYDGILKQFPTEFLSLYLDRASVRTRNMDFEGAVADYDMILKLDPVDPAKAQMIRPRVYEARAKVKSMGGDYAGAVADYTAALNADLAISKYKPGEIAYLHKDRAEAREEAGDLKGAIKDYDAALAADPGNSFMLSDRAKLKRYQRDYAGAIADYTAAIAKSPADADSHLSITYQERGVARLCKGDFAGALADLEKDASLTLAQDDRVYHSPIVHGSNLLIWALRARLEGKAKADAELSAHLAKSRRSGDPDREYDIANYFLGKAPESLLLEQAKSNNGSDAGKSVALYHIGMKKLVDGDTGGALANFNAVVNFNDSMQYMQELARAEAARIAASKAKPKAK